MKKITALVPDECEIEVLQAIRMVVPEKKLELKSEDHPPPISDQSRGVPPADELTTASFNGA